MGDGAYDADVMSDDGAEEHMRDMEREDYHKEMAFRRAVKREVQRQLRKHTAANPHQPKKHNARGKTKACKCLSCRKEFVARVADRKRGWSRFCSKSCAYKHKKKNGVFSL